MSNMEWGKAYQELCDNEKVPRKMKKAVLGRRLNKTKLRRKLRRVQVILNTYPQPATILPETFCPLCGCTESAGGGELCISDDSRDTCQQGYCLRCGFLVWEVDNSPMVHCLEWPEFDYKLA